MQIDECGRTTWFPMLPELSGESFRDRLERSRRAYQEEKERAREAEERRLTREAGVRIPLGHSSNIGHRRHRVPRPSTAGRW